MKRPRDPALELAKRIAAGDTPDPAELDHADPALARGMQRLAAITRALRPDAPAGATWGHLQRLELAGSGSFGDVYRAWDPTLDRTVALKLRRTDAPGAIFSGRDFVAEAQRLARVRHPHVLAVHGASYHADRAGIWTDWIEGETLHARLSRDGPLSRDALLALALDLADALAAVHAAGLVHGDVKAANVMLDAHGRAVLMDFGAGFKSSDDTAVLGAGTPRYLAPEIARGEPATQAVDVYALGVLLHRGATGAYPSDASAAGPPALRALLAKMQSGDPAQRPRAEAVVSALQHLRAAPLRRARRTIVAVLVLGLFAVAAVSFVGYRRAETLRLEAESSLARSESANRFLTELLGRASPQALGPTATLRDLLDAAPDLVARRFADRPADRATLYELLADLEAGLANDAASARNAQAASEAAALVDPAGDDALRLRGEALRRRALAGEGRAVLEESRALLARAEREQRSARVVGALAVALTDVETRLWLEHPSPESRATMMARLERVLADPAALDPRTAADALRRLGNLRFENGDHALGISLCRRAVTAAEDAYGRDHPLAALNRNVLAWQLMNVSQDAPEAERLLRFNLSLYTDKVGRGSRTYFDNAMALAYALAIQQRHAEALPLAEEASALAPGLYGTVHRSTFDAQLTLAEVLHGSGRGADAERVLAGLREAIRSSWGEDNRHYVLTTRQLAHVLREQQRNDEAQPLFADCAARAGRLLGAANPVAVDCRAQLNSAPP